MSWRGGVWRLEFLSPLPCPFNYGAAPQRKAPDGSGQDVIVIGPRMPRGACITVRPRMRVVFKDAGLPDDKLVARADGGALRLCDRLMVRLFFVVYGVFKRMRCARRRMLGRTGVVRYEEL